jgi:hypothetical protein
MAVSTKMSVFWVVALCSLVEVYQRFGGPCCLHHQGDHDATTQKRTISLTPFVTPPRYRWYLSVRL